MEFLILFVFIFCVKANISDTGSEDACGFERTDCDFELIDNEEYVTNDNYIVEPCYNKDYNCIRRFMAENSRCKRVYGPLPDPIYVAQSSVYNANSNITIIFAKTNIVGLSGASVKSFQYNVKTKVLTFAIDIPSLFFDIPQFYITYRKPGLQSIILLDRANATFNSLIFTANIPEIEKRFRLDLATAKHGYLGEAYPDFYIGPKAYTSTDPTVMAEYEAFLENVPLSARTLFLFSSEWLTFLYIQTYFCDFGVKLYTV